MHRRFNQLVNLLLGFIPYFGLTLAASTLSACNVSVPAQGKGKDPTVSALSVSCEPDDDALQCRAMGRDTRERTDPSNEADVTEAVAWATSSATTAAVVRGRVTANEPGVATIAASMRSGGETVSSSVLVVVDDSRTRPQVAYDLKGVVRELSNDGLKSVEVTLVDSGGHARTAITSGPDGAFHFAPLLSGQYSLRATKSGYRTVERPVNVPDPTPLTVVLLLDPQ